MENYVVCSICAKDQLVTDQESGELFCSKCGVVLSERSPDTRAEWRHFEGELVSDSSRVETPASLARHDMGQQELRNSNQSPTRSYVKAYKGLLRKDDDECKHLTG